jgi:DNA-binding NarL/FixJ family response regulator
MKSSEQLFTSRELQIIELISEGFSDKEIATQLALSLNTIRTHRKNILKQSENPNMIAVVKHCLKLGLIR